MERSDSPWRTPSSRFRGATISRVANGIAAFWRNPTARMFRRTGEHWSNGMDKGSSSSCTPAMRIRRWKNWSSDRQCFRKFGCGRFSGWRPAVLGSRLHRRLTIRSTADGSSRRQDRSGICCCIGGTGSSAARPCRERWIIRALLCNAPLFCSWRKRQMTERRRSISVWRRPTPLRISKPPTRAGGGFITKRAEGGTCPTEGAFWSPPAGSSTAYSLTAR